MEQSVKEKKKESDKSSSSVDKFYFNFLLTFVTHSCYLNTGRKKNYIF